MGVWELMYEDIQTWVNWNRCMGRTYISMGERDLIGMGIGVWELMYEDIQTWVNWNRCMGRTYTSMGEWE